MLAYILGITKGGNNGIKNRARFSRLQIGARGITYRSSFRNFKSGQKDKKSRQGFQIGAKRFQIGAEHDDILFCFQSRERLKVSSSTISKLLNFFICNVFKMLSEKVIILFTVTIFFTVTFVIVCWWCISVKLLFYSQRYERFSLFTRLLLIICRSNVTSLMSSFCIFVVYFCSCCFFLFLYTLFWRELLHASVDISDSLSLDVSSVSLLS